MRLRITFSKSGPLRYTGHLDLQTVWERTVRRASLPLAYTKGFHPGPRIQIASALPLGFGGRAEIVDIWLNEALVGEIRRVAPTEEQATQRVAPTDWIMDGSTDAAAMIAALQQVAPAGLTIVSVAAVDERGPALQTRVASAEYRVTLLEPQAGLEERIAALLQSPSLPRRWRDKDYDLRPLIESLSIDYTSFPSPAEADGNGSGAEGRGLILTMCLAARPGATGRPEQVLEALGLDLYSARIERTRLILQE